MPFGNIWSDSATRQQRRLDRGIARGMLEKVGQLSEDPFWWVRRISGVGAYRLRVGDYRVLLGIDGGRLRVLVVEVGHRGSVYGWTRTRETRYWRCSRGHIATEVE